MLTGLKGLKIIILDGAPINLGVEMVYLHAAVNLDLRRIPFLSLYPNRSIMSVYAFMKQFINRYG